MKKILKTFIDFERIAWWLIRSESTSETINSFDKIERLFEREMAVRKKSYIHDLNCIKQLQPSTDITNEAFHKPITITDYEKN